MIDFYPFYLIYFAIFLQLIGMIMVAVIDPYINSRQRLIVLANCLLIFTSLLPKMVDGSLMKDTKYEPDYAKSKIKITSGFPSEESLRIEAENIEFLKKTDEAIKRLEDGQADYKNKKDFVTDSAYAIFGQMYRTAGMHTPIDAATGKKISLEEFMQKQLKSGVFEKSLKSRKNPKKFTDPKNIAKMAKDKKQIQKIITSHTDRNKERRAHRAARKNNVEHQNAL